MSDCTICYRHIEDGKQVEDCYGQVYHEECGHTDKFGRRWPFPKSELCDECGQPDSCGDCNHQKLSDDDVALLVGEDSEGCPGCGCMPGDGLTADCTDENGCGFWREQGKSV